MTSPRPNSRASVRLVLVPDVGGTTATFRGWTERLPASADVGLVELPGRGSHFRAPLVSSVAEAAEHLAAEIMAGAGYPAALFGHGLGALIAFETARRLHGASWPVLALFVSGQGGPALESTTPPLSQLPLERFGLELQQRCDVLLTDTRTDPEVMRSLLSVVRDDMALKEHYRYEPAQPLTCPIVACDALADPQSPRTDLDAWRRETSGRFSVQRFGGDRSYVYREQEALTAFIGNHLSVMISALSRSAAVKR